MISAMDDTNSRPARLLAALQEVLGITAVELRPALTEAAGVVAGAVGADMVDAYLYESSCDSLVVVASYDSPMAMRRSAAGLDRLPLATGGLVAKVFKAGTCYRTGQADQEGGERRDAVEALGIGSEILCCLQANDDKLGVLEAVSAQPDRFCEADLRFLVAVAHWMGLIVRHAELVGEIAGCVVHDGHRPSSDELCRLTRRERQVAALVAGGLTNEEIGAKIVLATGTVSNHIEHILRKLGFNRRVQIATWALHQGLWSPDYE